MSRNKSFRMLLQAVSKRLHTVLLSLDPAFEHNEALNTFRLSTFGFLFVKLLELIVTASIYDKWTEELNFPSRFFAIVGSLVGLLLFESFGILLSRKPKWKKRQPLIVIPTIAIFFFFYQEVAYASSFEDTKFQLYYNLYEIVLYKVLFLTFCTIPIFRTMLILSDTIYLMIRITPFHTTRGISLVLLNLMMPFIIVRNSQKVAAVNPRKVLERSKSIQQNSEWVNELFNHLPEGIAVFEEDGTLQHYNDSMMHLLSCTDEEFLDTLFSLPNRDLITEMLVEEDDKLMPEMITNGLKSYQSLTPEYMPSTSPKVDSDPIKHSIAHFSKIKTPRSPALRMERLIGTGSSPRHNNKTFATSSSPANNNQLNFTKGFEFALKHLDQKEPNSPNARSKGGKNFSLTGPLPLEKNMSPSARSIHWQKKNEKASYSHGNVMKEKENVEHERIAQEQAIKLSFKNQNLKKKILTGEKFSKHSTVGDAIRSIINQIPINGINGENMGFTLAGLTSKHLLGPESINPHFIKAKSHKGISRTYRSAAPSPKLYNSAPEEPFTGLMSMNSFLKVSSEEIRYFAITFSSIVVQKKKCILLSVRDTTHQDAALRLQELDKKKNQTLAMVSHEYRSPLNGIVSALELLSEKIDPFYEQKFVKPALLSAKRLLSLVNDILDFHQLENQKLKFVFEPCIISDIAKSAMSVIEFTARSRGLELTLNIDDLLPKKIVTDANRLQQILLNLLSNALKFTMNGGIELKITSVGEGRILFEVKDTGIGIKPENLSKLFKEFGRIDLGANSSLNRQGVGLGLQISNELAKNLNSNPLEGGLEVQSIYGQGTTFSFIIEDFSKAQEENFFYTSEDQAEGGCARQEGAEGLLTQEVPGFVDTARHGRKADLESATRLLTLDTEPIRTENWLLSSQRLKPEILECADCSEILIVDDDVFNVLAVRNLLESFGFKNIDSAYNGAEAIKLVKEKTLSKCHNKYRIIFMDCNMPIMSGYEAAKQLSAMMNEGIIPKQNIIGLTGDAGERNLENCLKCGMKSMLTKPLTKREFKEKVFEFLKKTDKE